MGKMIGHMTGSTLCYSIWLGDELGLYRELAGTGPRNADSVAAKTGCNARLVRGWLRAHRGSGALAWGEHHPCLFCGTEWFFRTGYRAYLTTQWIPALDGVETKLRAGARVADVGCGHGASVVAMAAAYPNSTFCGFDFHAPSVETARQRAAEVGVGGRARFE